MREALRRWIRSQPFIITAVSIGITLASAGGFWLMAVTWPAVQYVSVVAWIIIIGVVSLAIWRSWRNGKTGRPKS